MTVHGRSSLRVAGEPPKVTMTLELGTGVDVWVDQCPDCRPILVIRSGGTQIQVQPADDVLTDADRLAAEALAVAVMRYQATVRSRLARRGALGGVCARGSA